MHDAAPSPAAAATARSFPTLISYLVVSVDETVSVSNSPHSPAPELPLFASLVKRLKPILHSMLQRNDGVPPVRTVVESLDAELRRARSLVRGSAGSALTVRLIEGSAHSIGRCLGLLLLAWDDAPDEVMEGMRTLHREMVTAQFGGRDIVPDLEDLLRRIQKGDEEELGAALSDLGFLTGEGLVGELGGGGGGGGVISVLLNRLSSGDKENRLKIILVLRSLASHCDMNKEMMADMEALSSVVGSLTGDVDESREAAGLLVDLLDISKAQQRMGRIQGCIMMLVGLLNGDDPRASGYAGELLGALSSNMQNVLLMAEAGYFIPLIQCLNQGSDMNRILMATIISRMELTDQMKASLGEEGSIDPLVKMLTSRKLEAKLSALGALRKLSSSPENITRLIKSRIVEPLLQLLFSVTSVLITLREPASAILASITQSELVLKYRDVARQMLSLLNQSTPAIQLHLLLALNNITSHSTARKVKAQLKANGAMQLLLLFVTASNAELRIVALNLLLNLSTDSTKELTEQLGEGHLSILVDIISASTSENEKAAAIGVLSNLPLKDRTTTEILARTNLLPVLISLLEASLSITGSASPTGRCCLLESIAGVMIRFTAPCDEKLQRASADHGVIPCLVRLLADGSALAKSRAATSLAQLSQNSLTVNKVKSARWLRAPPSQTFCEVHNGHCSVKSTFCLVKAGAISPMIRILEGKERETDVAVLEALATLVRDEIWDNGANVVEKASGVQAIIRVLEIGSLKAQEKAAWMLERIFRLETHRVRYRGAAEVVLIDLAQNGDPRLRPMIAKILAHLQHLQMQSSYF